jgi:hypothetical protein
MRRDRGLTDAPTAVDPLSPTTAPTAPLNFRTHPIERTKMPTATTTPAQPSDQPGAKEAPTLEATSSAPCYQHRAAADAAYKTAQDALDAARAGVASTKQALADAEAEAMEAIRPRRSSPGTARPPGPESTNRVRALRKHVATSNGRPSKCRRPSSRRAGVLMRRRAPTGQ